MDHELTIAEDGHWSCSCGYWGDLILGPIGRNVDEAWVRRRFLAHKNALVIQVDGRVFGPSVLEEALDVLAKRAGA